jgi:hypothetical protein
MTADTKNKSTGYKPGPEFEEGDPAKGKESHDEKVAVFGPPNTIAMRDRRAYLIDQAEKNQAANDEIQAKQVEANAKLADVMVEALDPDRLREETTQEALDEIDTHTPEYAAAARAQRQQILRTMHLKAGGFSPEDSFIAGAPAPPSELAAKHNQQALAQAQQAQQAKQQAK